MNGIKASFILTGSELMLLISRFDTGDRSFAAQYMADLFMKETVDTDKAEEGLVGKKLVRKASGMLFVEPVIELIVRNIITAEQAAIVKPIGCVKPFYIIFCSHMVLLLTSYELKEDSYKITPFPDIAALKGELSENGTDFNETEVKWVNGDEEKTSIDNKYGLLKEE